MQKSGITFYELNFTHMKKVTLLLAMVALVTLGFSQGAAPLSKGEKQLNFGLGFNNHGLPLYGTMDFAIHNDWTLGPVVKIVFGDDVWFGALGRVDYHWNRLLNIPSNWDFYAGASIGFLAGGDFELDAGVQVGGRWYWSDKWGLNLEFGGGTGYGTSFGLSMKL